MSRHRKDEPLSPPPERDVSPQLRARVLHAALRGEEPRARRRTTRLIPYVAGLAAAIVVLGVVYAVNRPDASEHTPATGGDVNIGQPVPDHSYVKNVLHVLKGTALHRVQRECEEATGVPADVRLTTVQLRSPIGPIDAGAYADEMSPTRMRAFCTPFQATVSQGGEVVVTSSAPVALIAGTRVQGTLPIQDGANLRAYYDGAWFQVTPAIAKIEARVIVDGSPGIWHATRGVHAFIFASTWRALTPAQAAQQVTVQYRAINADGVLVPFPELSTTVTPDESRALPVRTTIRP